MDQNLAYMFLSEAGSRGDYSVYKANADRIWFKG